MTPSDLQKQIDALRHKVRVLEEENAQLSERAEASLLLGLVSESIESLTNPQDIVDSVLERISILKNIPFTACGRLVGRDLEIVSAYASFTDQTGVGLPIRLQPSLVDELTQGPFVTTSATDVETNFAGQPFMPAVTAVIPFTSHVFSKGLFLFMRGEEQGERLASMLFLLDRIVDITVSRIDNQFLMKELESLNRELETRIETRTRALVATNEKLKTEISERKRSEQALKDAHKRFVTVLDGIDAHVYACDLQTYEIRFMNRKMKEDFSSHALGKKCYQTFRNEASPCTACTNNQLLDEDGNPDGVISWETKNPVTGRWNMNHDRAVEWVDGRLVKLQISVDITDIKRAEREKQLLQEKLQQSQKMEAVGTLAGGMAHDFNNLLMGIQGRTSLMLLEPDPSAVYHEHLKSIEAYVQNATGLTRQLLGFARGGKYDPKPTAINHIIEEGVSLFGRTKKEIRIHRNLLADLWAVEVDRGQIQQVLLNLYVNAWQAMPGGGDLFIQTANQVLTKAEAVRQQLAPGNYITITVRDTGVGMDPSILSKIFDPFFTTKERGRGTGLGLAASYGIIHNHGGTIVATSKPGKGAAFILYLPASERVPTADRLAHRPPLPGAGTVLLVDDEPMILDVGKMMLEKLGYQVETADSGAAALRKYGSHKTTIVILDMIMPDMGGGEVFDSLKSMDPEVRVLLSSGYSLSGQTQEVFNRGCSGFIQKPFTLDGLSHTLHTVLHNK